MPYSPDDTLQDEAEEVGAADSDIGDIESCLAPFGIGSLVSAIMPRSPNVLGSPFVFWRDSNGNLYIRFGGSTYGPLTPSNGGTSALNALTARGLIEELWRRLRNLG